MRAINLIACCAVVGTLVGCDMDPPPPPSTPTASGKSAAAKSTAPSQLVDESPPKVESEADQRLSAEIRERILDRDDFSINARNITIETSDGTVTLRGLVESPAERNALIDLASRMPEVRQVIDELKVSERAKDDPKV